MQQVGTREIIASAQVVDPRKLPALVHTSGQRALVALTHTWVLHKKRVLRGAFALAAVVTAGVVYEARDGIAAGVQSLRTVLEGEFAEAGFGISEIGITGQTLTLEADIIKALAIEPRITTLNYDAEAARARIEELPAVEQATVRKIYPGHVEVIVAEKVPVARWRVDGVTFLVDMNGDQIAVDAGGWSELPLIVGDGAADDALVMIKAMDRFAGVTQNLAALSRIGDRRWDLIYYSGLRVQLPELGVAQALTQLDSYQQRYTLLDRDVTLIDLRVPGMVTLKRGPTAQALVDEEAKKKKKK